MTSGSRRRVGLLLAMSVVLLAPSDCNIDIGNLSDFIVTHEITITNSAPDDAQVWIGGSGIKRRSVLRPGGQLSATVYAGDSLLISVSPGRDILGELKAKRDAIAAKLNAQPFDMAASLGIYQELNLYSAAIRTYEQRGHGQLCAADLKVDDKGRGNNVTAVITLEGDEFRIAC